MPGATLCAGSALASRRVPRGGVLKHHGHDVCQGTLVRSAGLLVCVVFRLHNSAVNSTEQRATRVTRVV